MFRQDFATRALANMHVSDCSPTGNTRLSEWVYQNRDHKGAQ